MDLQQLKIFINLASLKSFSRTAEVMFISQPNVSARIKGLEEELGATLFDRFRGRELALTAAGRLFLDYAQGIVNLYDEALERLSRQDSPAEGPVLVGASTVPGIYLLPPLLARFRETLPAVNTSLLILDSAQVIERVLAYSVDFGFVGSLRQDERLEYYPFAGDELVLITPPGLLGGDVGGTEPAGEKQAPLEACLSQNLLVREKGSATREIFEKALAEKGLSLRDFHSLTQVDSMEAIKQGVRFGLGVSPVSRHTAEDYIRLGLIDAFRLSGLDLSRRIYLVRHRGRVLSRAAELVLQFMLDAAKKNS